MTTFHNFYLYYERPPDLVELVLVAVLHVEQLRQYQESQHQGWADHGLSTLV